MPDEVAFREWACSTRRRRAKELLCQINLDPMAAGAIRVSFKLARWLPLDMHRETLDVVHTRFKRVRGGSFVQWAQDVTRAFRVARLAVAAHPVANRNHVAIG